MPNIAKIELLGNVIFVFYFVRVFFLMFSHYESNCLLFVMSVLSASVEIKMTYEGL